MKVRSHTPESFDLLHGGEATQPVPSDAAVQALRAHAGALPDLVYEEAPRPDYLKEDDIERVGSNFIDMTFQLLDYACCPPDVRQIVMAIVGLSGGDYANAHEFTQKRIAQRLGVSVDTVQERIGALWDWQRHQGRALVIIEEQDLQAGSRKYGTTKYQPVIIRYAGLFIRKLKARGLRPINRQQAIEEKLEPVLEEVALEVIDELPGVDLMKRRNRREKNVTPPQQKLSFIDDRERRVINAVHAWKDALTQAGYDPRDYINELIGKVETAANSR